MPNAQPAHRYTTLLIDGNTTAAQIAEMSSLIGVSVGFAARQRDFEPDEEGQLSLPAGLISSGKSE